LQCCCSCSLKKRKDFFLVPVSLLTIPWSFTKCLYDLIPLCSCCLHDLIKSYHCNYERTRYGGGILCNKGRIKFKIGFLKFMNIIHSPSK
jgi:hypothetical protein